MSAPTSELVVQALRAGAAECSARADIEVLGEVADGIEAGRYGLVLVTPPADNEKCDELGDAELTRNALRHAAHRAEVGGHHECAQRARAIADRLDGNVVDELFGQDGESIREQWRDRESRPPNYAPAGYELFPRGAEPESELGRYVWSSGALYALNAAVLHPLGLAFGVDINDAGEVVAVLLARGHESITFDELGHEVGTGKLGYRELDAIVTGLRETEARLKAELDKRTRPRADGGLGITLEGDTLDDAVYVEFVSAGRPVGRGVVQTNLRITRAQMSASIERLTKVGKLERTTVDGETLYGAARAS